MINTYINSFFERNDSFLNFQFEHAQGIVELEAVMKSHSNLIAYTRELNFNNDQFEQAKKKWLSILEGLSANLGFPQFKTLPNQANDLNFYLNKSREKLDNIDFIRVLREFSHQELQTNGLGLTTTPEIWLKDNDSPINSTIDPYLFKNKIFEITGFDCSGTEYKFVPSKHDNFFMMALHLTPTYCIGYGQLNTFFSLSTLTHEIGHTTTQRERSLPKLFLSYPDSLDDEMIVNDEDDSYLYEKFFIKHLYELMKEFKIDSDDGITNVLFKRKAIQYNTHLLANHLNYLFFSGESLDLISSIFEDRIKKICPEIEIQDDFSWLKYATLDKPLSRIGFIKAYHKNFL